MDISHDHIDFGPQIPILGSEGLFASFWSPKVYFFLLHVKFPILHDHIDFGPQILFLGSGGLFVPFWPPKVYTFLLHVKFPKDGYITRPYWFWAPNSVFGLWGPISVFLTPKSIFFLAPFKIPERWIYHTIILILGPKFRFWALRAYLRLFDPKKYIFSCSM
jgi:hypothetical protein